jgi:peptidoglycan LD-endopeptidase LytH
MRRLLPGVVLSLSAVALLVAPTVSASPLAEAQDKARSLRSQLQAATASLEAAEAALYQAEDVLAFDRRQVQSARAQRSAARAILAGQVAAMYRTGGLAMADALLDRDPALIPGRMELATVLMSRHAQLIADAQVADDAYAAALGRAAANQRKAEALRIQAQRAVRRLTDRLREAEAVQARLTRLQQQRSSAPKAAAAPRVAAGGVACLMEAPYSYVDTWGAPRSGGRSHQGTDVMAPYGAEVYAYTAGVVSRESTSTSGGIQLYLLGDNGVEYFYAHLSRYAVPAGTRVKAGQLVAYNGQSGNAQYTAPHVHFEVHPGGPGSAPVNPYPYVQRACG